MRSRGCAGSGRVLRLDPFALPVRFLASDAAADGRVREIELHRERVVLRRSRAGMRMALNMPVAAFAGISLRLVPGEGGAEDALAVVLEHADPALALPVLLTSQSDEALAEWRAWSYVLGLLLLLPEQGVRCERFPRLGEVQVNRPRPRRRSALKARRPSILLRRGHGRLTEATPVHRGEREIIARNYTTAGHAPHARRHARQTTEMLETLLTPLQFYGAALTIFISIRSASTCRSV